MAGRDSSALGPPEDLGRKGFKAHASPAGDPRNPLLILIDCRSRARRSRPRPDLRRSGSRAGSDRAGLLLAPDRCYEAVRGSGSTLGPGGEGPDLPPSVGGAGGRLEGAD